MRTVVVLLLLAAAATAGETLEEEEGKLGDLRSRIREVKESIGGMNREISKLNGEIRAERQRKQRLEMEVFKQRLKAGRWSVPA